MVAWPDGALTTLGKTLSCILQGNNGVFPVILTELSWRRPLLEEGIVPFLYQAFVEGRLTLPPTFQIFAKDAARHAVAVASLRQETMGQLQNVAKQQNLSLVVFKGAVYAHTCYEHPFLRPSNDIDLFLPFEQVPPFLSALRPLGFYPDGPFPPPAFKNQIILRKAQKGRDLLLDLHWHLSERTQDQASFTFANLEPNCVPFAPFPALLTFSPSFALFWAAKHMVDHHPNERRLLWYLDLALMLKQQTTEQKEQVARWLNRFPEAASPLVEGHQWLGFEWPPGWPDLTTQARRDTTTRQLHRVQQELSRLKGLNEKGRWLHQRLFPGVPYLKQRFRFQSPWLVPLFWLWRLARGMAFLFKKTG
jgi:hypothetical protein